MDMQLIRDLRILVRSGKGVSELVKVIESKARASNQHVYLAVLSYLRITFGIALRDCRQLELWTKFGGQRYNDEEIDGLFEGLIREKEPLWKECVGPVFEVTDKFGSDETTYHPDGRIEESGPGRGRRKRSL